MKRIAVVTSIGLCLLVPRCSAALVGITSVPSVSPTSVELSGNPILDIHVWPELAGETPSSATDSVARLLAGARTAARSTTTVLSHVFAGGSAAADELDDLSHLLTREGPRSSAVFDAWVYLKDQEPNPVTRMSRTTTTTAPEMTSGLPGPDATPAAATARAPISAGTPARTPSRELRVRCPNGELLVLINMPSMAEVRETCNMKHDALSGSGSTSITCADGSTHTFDRSLSQTERQQACEGRSTPPRPTTVPTTATRRVVRVDATDQGGAWGRSGFAMATEEACPMVAEIAYAIHFDDGSVQTGNLSVPVDSGREVSGVRFIYRGPGGVAGCGRSMVVG